MKLEINNYTGPKGGMGIHQWIINNIPEFDFFIELFTGSGIISEKLIQTNGNSVFVLYEKSYTVASQLLKKFEKSVFVKHHDSILKYNQFLEKGNTFDSSNCFYADPPCLMSKRRYKGDVYEFEWTTLEHIHFLELVLKLSKQGARIIIRHYDCELYQEILKGWHTATQKTMTRGGVATEKIWMNYDPAKLKLYTVDYLGKNHTDRQRIKRKVKTFSEKIRKLPLHEQQAVLQAIQKELQ